MYKTRKITFFGQSVHIIEAKEDTLHQVRMSILGDKFGTPIKLVDAYHDIELEADGWRRIGIVNGGLFFTEGTTTYAEGIEKIQGEIHELDDARLDSCIALATLNDFPYIATQGYIKSKIDRFRGAVTSAFGLINNGFRDTRGSSQRNAIYKLRSGRTIIGRKPDKTIVLASIAGVTGRSGITGSQAVDLARSLGLNNAVCMDGGGSVCMKYQDIWKIKTSWKIKNAVAIYVKSKG